MTSEHHRLDQARTLETPWKKWGPYLSERQWGTVREDYSEDGNAWNYFTHDQAWSRAYRWGEDGLAGISDDHQILCFALALWNGKDPILKERLFGLTNSEGNHGEDVKEYYFYLDSTRMFGGNSNWRGPVWMPVNFLLYTSLLRLAAYYGDSFKVECPIGSGKYMNLFEVAHELAERLIRTFVQDGSGRRPVFGGAEKFQTDQNWRDNILFYEYFHGDNGAGIGASHQTGWTGCIARIIQANGAFTADLLSERDLERRAISMGKSKSLSEDRSRVALPDQVRTD
jgi:hypothetical protein